MAIGRQIIVNSGRLVVDLITEPICGCVSIYFQWNFALGLMKEATRAPICYLSIFY